MKHLERILAENGCRWLERKQQQVLELSAFEVKLIAAAYGMHPLMFDPLIAPESNHQIATPDLHVQEIKDMKPMAELPDDQMRPFVQKHLANHLKNFRERSQLTHDQIQERLNYFSEHKDKLPTGPYGTGKYETPSGRLRGTHDAAVVRLTLSQGQESDWHRHPGDELLFVLGGSVEVGLTDTGLEIPVGKHSFVHFYSEQRHGVRCLSRSSEILVVRFLQLDPPGPRYKLLRELADAPQNKEWDQDLKRRMKDEIFKTLLPFDLVLDVPQLVEDPQVIVDRRGLARLLEFAASRPFRDNKLSPSKLSKSIIDSNDKYTRAFFDNLRKGQAKVVRDDLPNLANAYGIQEFLLHDYLRPTRRPQIVVKAPNDGSVRDDWCKLPENVIARPGVTYLGPRRRLADAGISVSFIRFAANTETPANRHPGHELLVPLSGTLEVSVAGEKFNVVHETHFYAQYNSSKWHSVRNPGPKEATMLVVRFYE